MKLTGNLPFAEYSIIVVALSPPFFFFLIVLFLPLPSFLVLLKAELFIPSFFPPFNFFRWFLVMLWEIPLHLLSASQALHPQLQEVGRTA